MPFILNVFSFFLSMTMTVPMAVPVPMAVAMPTFCVDMHMETVLTLFYVVRQLQEPVIIRTGEQ